MNIGELFRLHGSDKDGANGTGHSYGPTYQLLLEPVRESVRSVLELGVLGGGSLRAWRDFFPNAEIVGLDINPEAMLSDVERVATVVCDTTNRARLDDVLGDRTFDLVIDDGSHNEPDQLGAYTALWRRVRLGGLYVVEDVIDPSAFRALGAVIYDLRHERPERGWDNQMCVFRK